jgi:hypothetical protein
MCLCLSTSLILRRRPDCPKIEYIYYNDNIKFQGKLKVVRHLGFVKINTLMSTCAIVTHAKGYTGVSSSMYRRDLIDEATKK